MNAPYSPSSFSARVGRQVARFAARRALPIHPDHAIVSFTFDDFPKSAATLGAPALEQRGWQRLAEAIKSSINAHQTARSAVTDWHPQ